MFRLYVRPANYSAYEMILLLTVPYAAVAFLLLKRVRLVRWLAVAWVIFGIGRALIGIGTWSRHWDVLWIVVLGWVLQLTVLALLFSPQGNRHFESKNA